MAMKRKKSEVTDYETWGFYMILWFTLLVMMYYFVSVFLFFFVINVKYFIIDQGRIHIVYLFLVIFHQFIPMVGLYFHQF